MFNPEIPAQDSELDQELKNSQSEEIVKFFNQSIVNKTEDPKENLENWIQNISFDDFEKYLVNINGILRHLPDEKRRIDGENVEVGGNHGVDYIPPYPDQKQFLTKELFEAVKEISSNKDRALLLYYGIESIHLFADGNGRMGRVLYEFFSNEGNSFSMEDINRLTAGHDGDNETEEARKEFNGKVLEVPTAHDLINREIVKDTLGQDFLEKYGKVYFSGARGDCETDNKSINKILSDAANRQAFPQRAIVIMEILKEKSEMEKYSYKINRQTEIGDSPHPGDENKEIIGIDMEKLDSDLTGDDIKRIINIHRDLKVKFIEKMIDIFKNPEKYPIEANNGKFLKDLFVINKDKAESN